MGRERTPRRPRAVWLLVLALAAAVGVFALTPRADRDPGVLPELPTPVVTQPPPPPHDKNADCTPNLTPELDPAHVSGEPMPTGDEPGWRLVFADDFRYDAEQGTFPGAGYVDCWDVYDGFEDTSGNGRYAEPRIVSVADGLLDVHLRTEDGESLVAALVPLVGGDWQGQTYGRYTVRFRADPVVGYKAAWLLWPTSEVWADGEVNFPEGPLDATMGAYNHCVGEPWRNCFDHDTGVRFDAGWHTATIEWTPAGVRYLLNGQVVGESDLSPSVPMRWVLQTETSYFNEGGHLPPPPDSAGHVQIDWVAVYAPAGP